MQESCDGLVRACLELDRARGNEDPAGKLRPEIVEEVSEGTIHKMCVYRNATVIMFYSTHGHHFFRRGGGEIFFMCTWVKNGYRGGDVFGCHSLGEEGGKGGGEKIFT